MDVPASLHTPLHDWHQAHNGRLVDFAGWHMPLHYGSIVEEHHAVRNRAGAFDISHMGRLTFHGPGVLDWLEQLTTNHVARLAEGQVQYSLMLDEAGGILDDILVYRNPFGYAVVCNASNRVRVVEQFLAHRPAVAADADFVDRTLDTAMIAIQGPASLEVVQAHCSVSLAALRYYHSTMARVADAEAVVSRTGYTGEDGFELIVPAAKAVAVWDALLSATSGPVPLPSGLGARDTLRFEAAMPLYGHELGPDVSPYEAGVGWAVKPAKGEFLGRDALKPRSSVERTRVGLALEGKRIARQGYEVRREGRTIGIVTSGTFAPTLGRSLAMALVDRDHAGTGQVLAVDIRGHEEPAVVVDLPFYRRDRHLNAALEQPKS